MKRVLLQAEKREVGGKGGARRLRRSDRVPAIIYGNEVEETIHIAIDRKVLTHTVPACRRSAIVMARRISRVHTPAASP